MEISTLVCDKTALKLGFERPELKIYQNKETHNNEYLEVCPEHDDYHEILDIFKTTNRKLMLFYGQNETFMLTTTIGFQIIQIANILYFDYNNAKKNWMAVLTDKTCLQLRRNTTANQILRFSTSFFRISQQHIININQLVRIDGKKCILAIQPNDTTLQISRTNLKKLQEQFLMI